MPELLDLINDLYPPGDTLIGDDNELTIAWRATLLELLMAGVEADPPLQQNLLLPAARLTALLALAHRLAYLDDDLVADAHARLAALTQ